MIDPRDVPPVADNELLARFILSSRHIRSSDETIKPEAFMPHPYTELSVTRHRNASEQEMWNAGNAIANHQSRKLRGRGDVRATAFLDQNLAVKADPVLNQPGLPDNPNHANITGWPKEDKPRQKLFAMKIAAQAKLLFPPS